MQVIKDLADKVFYLILDLIKYPLILLPSADQSGILQIGKMS